MNLRSAEDVHAYAMHQYHTLPLCTVPQAQVPTSNLVQRSWESTRAMAIDIDMDSVSVLPP